jgi:hypothetical protein
VATTKAKNWRGKCSEPSVLMAPPELFHGIEWFFRKRKGMDDPMKAGVELCHMITGNSSNAASDAAPDEEMSSVLDLKSHDNNDETIRLPQQEPHFRCAWYICHNCGSSAHHESWTCDHDYSCAECGGAECGNLMCPCYLGYVL